MSLSKCRQQTMSCRPDQPGPKKPHPQLSLHGALTRKAVSQVERGRGFSSGAWVGAAYAVVASESCSEWPGGATSLMRSAAGGATLRAMHIPPPISLNDTWVAEIAGSKAKVPSLRAFACRGERVQLTRHFDVPPMLDVCLRFDLHITAAPGRVVLSINDLRLAEMDGGQPFIFDVTDFISLEDNALTLDVDGGHDGAFGDVFLKAEPCGK